MNILVVEDSATLRFAMQGYIRDAGHNCILAENGEKAVQIVDPNTTDLIIMDVEMPGLNGFETTRLIREDLDDHWIPIIFITGRNDEESFAKGINAGGDDYLIKPISKTILHVKIAAIARIINMRDQLKALNTELVELSQTDSLTKLLNRRSFEEKANEAWRQAKRNRFPLSVLLLDIDYFKQYNDRYGHPEGDRCIEQIATALSTRCARVGDLVARYGGEEFIILLPNTDAQSAEYIAGQICNDIRSLNIEHKASKLYDIVTISIGGATLNYVTGIKLSNAINTADMALYESKNKGRNRVHIWMMNNTHRILILAQNDTQKALEDALIGHCERIVVKARDDIESLVPINKPSLVIVYADNEADESMSNYRLLKRRENISCAPLVLYTHKNSSISKKSASELGADDIWFNDGNLAQIVAKIADIININKLF